jgi:peptidyl-tRNA hydrolase
MATRKRTTRKKKVAEQRIYVIVPETVQVVQKRGKRPVTVRMEPGRLMAQCAHVVSRMRVDRADRLRFDRITTIVLSVRNSRELDMIHDSLDQHLVLVYEFLDHNPAFYGTQSNIKTALCTQPIIKDEVDAVIGHLELYG